MQTKTMAKAVLLPPIAALVAVFMLLAVAVGPASAYDPAYAVPAGVKQTGQTDTSVSLTWVKSPNVPMYRVQLYTKADMSDSVYYRFTENVVQAKGLVKGTAYKVRVRGITVEGASLTAYSAAITATTAAEPAYAIPTGMTAKVSTPTSIDVSWNAVANATRYRVQVYSKANMSDSTYKIFTATSGKI